MLDAMSKPLAINDVASRFSLKKLLLLPVVFSVALVLWRISPLHGIVGLITATALSCAILLAEGKNHTLLAGKFLLAILFAVFAGGASEMTLMSHGPPTVFSLLRGYGAIVVGGMLGWSIPHLITQRGRDSAFRKSTLVSLMLAAFLLTIVCSVPLWWHLWLSEQEQNFPRVESFVPTMRYDLTENPAFGDVHVESSRDNGGCVLVVGSLGSVDELADLKNIVAENAPPVSVIYALTVAGDAEHGD